MTTTDILRPDLAVHSSFTLAPNSHLLRKTFGPNLFITLSKTEAAQHKTSSNKNIKKLHKLLQEMKNCWICLRNAGNMWRLKENNDYLDGKGFPKWDPLHSMPFAEQNLFFLGGGQFYRPPHDKKLKISIPYRIEPKHCWLQWGQQFVQIIKKSLIPTHDNLRAINPEDADNPDRFIFSNDILDEGVASGCRGGRIGRKNRICLISNHIT